jgi:hypothetical protein
MLTESGVCVDAQIQELCLRTHTPLKVQFFSNGEAKRDCAFHWLFGIPLANGERYAVDLCASQFASIPGAKPPSCVEPLQEYIRRVAPSTDGGFDMCIESFGFHRKALEEARLEATQEERAKQAVRQFDVDCLAQKLAVKHLEGANKHWLHAQSTTLNEALGYAAPKFAHIFCTIVWPIELMAREQRKRDADPSTIVSEILSGAKDLKDMGP